MTLIDLNCSDIPCEFKYVHSKSFQKEGLYLGFLIYV